MVFAILTFNQPYEHALQAERALFPPLWAANAHLTTVQNFLDRQKP